MKKNRNIEGCQKKLQFENFDYRTMNKMWWDANMQAICCVHMIKLIITK